MIDPELFRIKVGNYKERWYIDPLPGCDIVGQDLDWRGPAVSTVKKASSKDWTQIALGRAADWILKAQPTFDEMGKQDVYSALSQANSTALDLASTRGTQIHKMFEVYAQGGDPQSVELSFEAEGYRDTVMRCIRTLQPKIVASEFLAISRSVGYGGTGDAIWDLHVGPFDGLYLVDYKSRTENHQAYIEEAWQVAAYAKADYMIGTDSAQAVRQRLPELAGGIILSLTPATYQLFSVDIAASWPGFLTLRRHWQHRMDGKSQLFGKPWAPAQGRHEWIMERIERIRAINIQQLKVNWPQGVPTPAIVEEWSDENIDLIIPAVEFAETQLGIPFATQDPTRPHRRPHEIEYDKQMTEWAQEEPPPPDPVEEEEVIEPVGHPTPAEGELKPEALPLISHRWSLLKGTKRDWINSVVLEAHECDLPIRVAEQPTERRVSIAKALIIAAEQDYDLVTIQSCVAITTQLLPSAVEAMTLGAAVGMMNHTEAAEFLRCIKMARPIGAMVESPPDNPDFTYREKGEALTYDEKGKPSGVADKVSVKEKPKPATAARPARVAKKAAPKTNTPAKKAAPRKKK